MNLQSPLRSISVGITAACTVWCGLVCNTSRAQSSPNSENAKRYQLIEEWSVAAQGPVHLREKRVKSLFQIDVVDRGIDPDGKRELQLQFVETHATAEIPAQKRSGSFDSNATPQKSAVEHHELVRAMAFAGQSLQVTISPEGELTQISGTEGLIRRLDEIYDEGLTGSEQDLYTRDVERQRILGEELCKSWADVFCVSRSELTESQLIPDRITTANFMACIPSESWMLPIMLTVRESVRHTAQTEGFIQIEKSATLLDSNIERTMIGAAPWTYEPREVECESTMLVRPDGLVAAMKSSSTAVLSTSLSLGMEIPIQMTICHSLELTQP